MPNQEVSVMTANTSIRSIDSNQCSRISLEEARHMNVDTLHRETMYLLGFPPISSEFDLGIKLTEIHNDRVTPVELYFEEADMPEKKAEFLRSVEIYGRPVSFFTPPHDEPDLP